MTCWPFQDETHGLDVALKFNQLLGKYSPMQLSVAVISHCWILNGHSLEASVGSRKNEFWSLYKSCSCPELHGLINEPEKWMWFSWNHKWSERELQQKSLSSGGGSMNSEYVEECNGWSQVLNIIDDHYSWIKNSAKGEISLWLETY